MLESPVKAHFQELHIEEFQDIITSPPHWLVRWGLILLLALIIFLITMCFLIRYPDVVPATFFLTGDNPPRNVIARSEGRLDQLLIKDGAQVKAGEILAILESVANTGEVLGLERQLHKWDDLVKRGHWEKAVQENPGTFGRLGELQNDFQIFSLRLFELKSALNGGVYLEKRVLLQKEAEDLGNLAVILGEQLALHSREFKLAEEEFEIQEQLFKKKVIALSEYKREQGKLLGKESPLKSIRASIVQNRSSQISKQREIIELDNTIRQEKSNFLQALQTLGSKISLWKQRYLIEAPLSGKISFSAPWTEQQFIENGQHIFTIEPVTSQFEGIIKISQSNLGKIQNGQRVFIKLDGYPYRQYGLLQGYVNRLSPTPGTDSLYWGYVSLPDQLQTRYGRRLQYRSGMRGVAEIITEDRLLFEKLLGSVRNGGQ